MNLLRQQSRFSSIWMAINLMIASTALGRGDDRLVGVWAFNDGFQIVELLLRSDGRYQHNERNADPTVDNSITERGYYEASGQALILKPYDYFGEPSGIRYEYEVNGDTLTLVRSEFSIVKVYQFQPGSREGVLAREQVEPGLVGTWGRNLQFFGRIEYTFRPGGYYFLRNINEGSDFPDEYIRGRYTQNGTGLAIKPYSGVEKQYELDFFGNTLTLIESDGTSGQSATYEILPGSTAEVQAKAEEADAFLNREHWQVGVWELRDGVNNVDLTLRPDGYYQATNATELLRGIVRGRYTLEANRLHFFPFLGQSIYSRDNGDYGKVERIRELDYYDGELQIIDLEALSQAVSIARKIPGSETAVMEKALQAQAERARPDWHIGIWEVNDPTGWMEFTYRPDQRYIAKAGTDGVPSQVERGQYLIASNKITLAPYSGQNAPRGFDWDLYDGDLFLIGDAQRLIIARKIPGSETGVSEKTRNPTALKGERGSILGLWSANLPGYSAELVFRTDGEFRLKRCQFDTTSHDYGLYTVDMSTRSLVYDSRFVPVQAQGMDFYDDTLTIYGGLGAPSSYAINLGVVDAAIEASLVADAEEAIIDAQWLARVPIGSRDPNAVQIPVGDIPADPNPGRIFDSPTVLSNYQLYRRLIPGFVYFNHLGDIKSVAVTHTREWHFFPTGRVLVRFKNQRAGLVYPVTMTDVSDSWGAYRIEPKPEQRDILHIYADNVLFIESDLGEQAEMTLEDGRRNLFWNKDYMILSEWAAERKSVPCQPPANSNLNLINTGVSLATTIDPDPIGGPVGTTRPISFRISGPMSGNFTLSGTTEVAGNLVTERTTNLVSPIVWQPVQTNSVSAGPFSFQIPQGSHPAAFFRLRGR